MYILYVCLTVFVFWWHWVLEYWTHWITLKLKINIILSFVLNWRLWEVGNGVIFGEEVYYYYHWTAHYVGWSNNYVMLALTFSTTHSSQGGQEMRSPPQLAPPQENLHISETLHTLQLDLKLRQLTKFTKIRGNEQLKHQWEV